MIHTNKGRVNDTYKQRKSGWYIQTKEEWMLHTNKGRVDDTYKQRKSGWYIQTKEEWMIHTNKGRVDDTYKQQKSGWNIQTKEEWMIHTNKGRVNDTYKQQKSECYIQTKEEWMIHTNKGRVNDTYKQRKSEWYIQTTEEWMIHASPTAYTITNYYCYPDVQHSSYSHFRVSSPVRTLQSLTWLKWTAESHVMVTMVLTRDAPQFQYFNQWVLAVCKVRTGLGHPEMTIHILCMSIEPTTHLAPPTLVLLTVCAPVSWAIHWELWCGSDLGLWLAGGWSLPTVSVLVRNAAEMNGAS